jgi:hypothetical protein
LAFPEKADIVTACAAAAICSHAAGGRQPITGEADDRHSCLLAYFERGVVVLDFVVWLRTSFTPSLRWP